METADTVDGRQTDAVFSCLFALKGDHAQHETEHRHCGWSRVLPFGGRANGNPSISASGMFIHEASILAVILKRYAFNRLQPEEKRNGFVQP